MKGPSSRTIAAAVGALALSGVAVVAVAASDDAPAPTTTQTGTDEPGDLPSPGETAGTADSPDADDSGTGTATDGVTSDQAVAIAERALADLGSVPALDEVEREFEHGRDVWEVEFGDEHEVYVDAVTGEVLKIEVDDDDRDDDDDRYDDDDDDDRYDDDDDDDDRYDD